MTVQEIITKALREAGFTSEFYVKATIALHKGKPLWVDPEDKDTYHALVEAIPGVQSDEGQADGYEFEIDPEEFTVESEKQLAALIKELRPRYQRAERNERRRNARRSK